MADRHIVCRNCGRDFTWTTGEQRFFQERGLQAPRRCAECRKAEPLARRSSPYQLFGAATLLAALALAAALLWFRVPAWLAWLAGVNAVAFATYGYDKAVAGRGSRRSPELILLGLALAGGSPGALLGMLLFRHKTTKQPFLRWFWLIVAVQVALAAAWLVLR